MRTVSRYTVCAALAVALIAGCAKSGSQGAGPGANQTASSFPVYSPSTIAAVSKYDDSAEVTNLGSSFFGEGADATKPFIGTQELIKTSASIDELEAWIKKLYQSPPEDLTPSEAATPRTSVNQPFVDALATFGLVPAEFWSKDRGRVVMLIVLDPKRVADHAGALMGVLDMYDKMPLPLRGGLDQTVKKQAGLSPSDLMNPSTPMGMIVYAARNWKNDDARAIILVDANRQPYSLPTPHGN